MSLYHSLDNLPAPPGCQSSYVTLTAPIHHTMGSFPSLAYQAILRSVKNLEVARKPWIVRRDVMLGYQGAGPRGQLFTIWCDPLPVFSLLVYGDGSALAGHCLDSKGVYAPDFSLFPQPLEIRTREIKILKKTREGALRSRDPRFGDLAADMRRLSRAMVGLPPWAAKRQGQPTRPRGPLFVEILGEATPLLWPVWQGFAHLDAGEQARDWMKYLASLIGAALDAEPLTLSLRPGPDKGALQKPWFALHQSTRFRTCAPVDRVLDVLELEYPAFLSSWQGAPNWRPDGNLDGPDILHTQIPQRSDLSAHARLHGARYRDALVGVLGNSVSI